MRESHAKCVRLGRSAYRCKFYHFRAGNPAFRWPFYFPVKLSCFCAHFTLIVYVYIYIVLCFSCLEFKAASTRAAILPGRWISWVNPNPPN